MNTETESLDRMQVRIPSELKAWLKVKAKRESRSMNAQLVCFLEKMKQSDCKQAA